MMQNRKAKVSASTSQELPLDIVGGSTFGRFPKISTATTWNMIISDGWLVPYAGYTLVAAIVGGDAAGRGIYQSVRLGKMIVVINELVFVVNKNLSFTQIGTLDTFTGDVFIDENTLGQISICDKSSIWVYNYAFGSNPVTFRKATQDVGHAVPLDFLPGYVIFQDGKMVSVDLNSAQWCLSLDTDASVYPLDAQHRGVFQGKPDLPLAVSRLPGRENFLFLFGSIITQEWQDTGNILFPYEKSTGINIDYGCINSDTIASLDNIVVWLAANEKSGPFIMYSTGGDPKQISTDGINFRLAQLTNPQDSHGFLIKLNGHLIYHFCFPTDNQSYIYDFNTDKFFNVCDEFMNYYIAKKIVYFNNTYYFVSLNDGNLYEMGSEIESYNGEEIPRARVCSTIRLPDTSPFITNTISFPIEQGFDGGVYEFNNLATESGSIITTTSGIPICTNKVEYALPRVDLSISIDGGYNFGSYDGMVLNDIGQRLNKFIYYNLGWSNEFVPQFRFFGFGRTVVGQGVVSIYQ